MNKRKLKEVLDNLGPDVIEVLYFNQDGTQIDLDNYLENEFDNLEVLYIEKVLIDSENSVRILEIVNITLDITKFYYTLSIEDLLNFHLRSAKTIGDINTCFILTMSFIQSDFQKKYKAADLKEICITNAKNKNLTISENSFDSIDVLIDSL